MKYHSQLLQVVGSGAPRAVGKRTAVQELQVWERRAEERGRATSSSPTP